jgi:tRNA pseudouridine55 synthase
LSIDGQLLLDKPAGITSFSALKGLKNSLGTGRVGHTGTLDRFATGLLIALVGKYTKLAGLFSDLDKCYQATVVFGSRTDTLDPEGEVIEEGPIPVLKRIQEAVERLQGPIDQTPPVYSAVHVEGRRAYRIARAGGSPEFNPRRVTIYRLDIVDFKAPELDIVVECSKGTYVRALARDLGLFSGSCAYLKSLRRTKVGPYQVSEVASAERLAEYKPEQLLDGSLERLLRLDGISAVTVKDASAAGVRNGQRLDDRFFDSAPRADGLYALLDSSGSLLAIAARDHGKYRYKAVL